MDLGLLTDLPLGVLLFACGIAVLAGVIKGAVGFALPLVMVSGLSSVMDPKLAVAGMLFGVLATNALQTFRGGVAPAVAASQTHWRYLLMVCIAIFGAAQLVAVIPVRAFYFVLGVPVVFLSIAQLAGVQVMIPKQRRRAAEWIAGAISGFMGGLAGTWGPTTVLYLMAIETPKAKQMVVQGVIYGIGSITLFVAHLNSGILNAETAPFSMAMVPLAFAGMWVGFRIQDRMDQEKFRRLTLIVLVIGGVNLLRKGMIG